MDIIDLIPYQTYDILIYDKDGSRSLEAADALACQGFVSLYAVTDGLDVWMANGYETFMTEEDMDICTSLPPMAYAGPDQVVSENRQVTLNGWGQDPDGGEVTYEWIQILGDTPPDLSGLTSSTLTFTSFGQLTSNERLVFHLTVTDDEGDKDTDSVTVNVNWYNDPPEANAGLDQTVEPGNEVILDGSGSSDPEGDELSYHWMISAANFEPDLSDENAVTPSFTVPSDTPEGSYVVFLLTVTDTGGKEDTATVTITVDASTPENQAPTANAGTNQTKTEGDTVTLDGSGSSDSDGSIAGYLWTQTGGVSVPLSSRSAVNPSFTAPEVDAQTSLSFTLEVTDDDGAKDTDTVSVTIKDNGNDDDDDDGNEGFFHFLRLIFSLLKGV